MSLKSIIKKSYSFLWEKEYLNSMAASMSCSHVSSVHMAEDQLPSGSHHIIGERGHLCGLEDQGLM